MTAPDGSGGPALLAVEGLRVCYGRKVVLDDVALTVREGEVVALLGTNGAGKSTLLGAVSGVLPIAAGRVTFAGRDVTGWSPDRVLAAGLLHVPGGRGTFASLTVEESLRVGAYTLRHDRKRLAGALERIYATFPRLYERRDQRAGTLSGGEQQMLVVARALALEPRLLCVDELTLGLAPVVARELVDLVAALRDSGVAVLLVEQGVNLALEIAERAYFLERGQVRFGGPAAALRGRSDLLRSVFLAGAAP